MLKPYADLLRTPGVASTLAVNVLGRLPNGMAVLALTLLFRHAGLDFTTVGLLVAVYGIGTGLGGPALGRLVDFHGQPRVLVGSGLVSAAAFTWLAFDPAAPLPVSIALSAVAGALTPPLESCLRSVWPDLVPDPRSRETAYSLDATVQELVFVTAPVLVAALSALFLPMHAVLATAAITALGAVGFAALRPVRRWRPVPRRADWMGPLREAPIRRILACFVFVGAALGAISVGSVAYAEDVGAPDLAGVLLAANGAGALAGGLAYGAIRFTGPPTARFRLLLAAFALSYLPLALLPGPVWMTALAALSGLFLAPVLACTFLLLGRLAPPGTSTEAFSWLMASFVLGSSAGISLTGAALEYGGTRAGFVLACGSAVLAALFSLRVRTFPRAVAAPVRTG